MSLLSGLTGCSTAQFLFQAGKGQLMLLNRAKPVDEVVSDERVNESLRSLLSRIPDIRAFGERQGLKPTSNYREYVELPGDSVVHVVTVSDALSFRPEIFSFPLVGSFTYIGWFDRKDAEEFALEYRQRGLDVDIRGAAAYSTLGWFPDPLLSTMIPKTGEGQIHPDALPALVHVFLHESVHATLYFKDQSYFNESLADFVADVLTDRYFRSGGPESQAVWERYQEKQKRSEGVRSQLATAYQELDTLYRSGVSDPEKLKGKSRIFESLRSTAGIQRELNNASLIQYKTYDPSDRGFRELLDRYRGDVPLFLKRLSKLTRADFGASQREDVRGVLEAIRD
jgi:predicted aminopeptidase